MKSVYLTFWGIIILALVSLWFNLPSVNQLPNQVKIFSQQINLQPLKNSKWEPDIFGRKINLSPLTLANLTGKYPIKLGLDLQGGTELTLQTQMDKISPGDRDTALEAARQVIENRVNAYGVSEAVVQSAHVGQDRRILVELPGVKDINTAVSLVGQTAQLEFRQLPASPSAEATSSRLISTDTTEPTGLTGADLKSAQVTFGTSNGQSGPEVQLNFTPQGAQKFADITKKNLGKPLPIFLDGVPIEAPVVQQEIDGGNAVISGRFTTDQAKNLAIQLSAGALPVPIKIIEQQQIPASLGASFIQKSLVAGIIGLSIVAIYMIAFYGIYGIIADLALLIYSLTVLAIFRTGLFILPQVTLTLAGIAGFILSIGMAVDANILTFERIKEEFRAGKSPSLALNQGFSRSWTSIRDSNISTLMTSAILYIFGTSVVKGFAITLAIGVLVSMFSAIIVTRTFLRLLPRFRTNKLS